jgi:hypothetical protein
VLALLAVGLAATVVRAENTGPFYALFYDGSHVSAPAPPNDVWSADEAMVGGRRLFGAGNPVRMLQDTTACVAPKGPRVVMANGDVLPGKIIGFLPASSENDTSARLLIALDESLCPIDPGPLAVRADQVMRIRTAADDPRAVPGSLRLANGARLTATAMRWGDQGLKALTEKGLTSVAFDAIAELDALRVDVMRAVLDDSFYPPVGRAAVIGRLETVQGAVLTYRRGMTLLGVSKPSPTTPGGRPSTAYLLVQPNWSSTMIPVPILSIWRESFRAADEVPLSLLPASTLSEKAGFHRWPWRRNENVEGGTLASGSIAVDLGIGTHSCCEIAFELPPQATFFTSLVGLQRHMGPGACARCKICPDRLADKPLYASGILRDEREPSLVGPLRVAGFRKLVLVTEWAGDDGPAGTYPLDIGGHVDWLMPLVNVDADDACYCQSLQRFVPGWAKWELAPADVRQVRIEPCWDTARECWLPVMYAVDPQPLTIRRTLSPVSPANDLLKLVFASSPDEPLPAIELRVDGAPVAPTTEPREDGGAGLKPLPAQSAKAKPAASKGRARQAAGSGDLAETVPPHQVRTLRWDLRTFHGRTVRLTLSISLHKQAKGVVWREFAALPASSKL